MKDAEQSGAETPDEELEKARRAYAFQLVALLNNPDIPEEFKQGLYRTLPDSFYDSDAAIAGGIVAEDITAQGALS